MNARSLSPGLAWGVLILGLVLVGCSGDDGLPGPEGPAGPEGPQGPPGNLAGPFLRSDLATTIEACAVCHGPGTAHDVQVVHSEGEAASIPSFLPPIDASVDGYLLDGVPLVSQITGVTIGTPDTVTFTLRTADNDIPVLGLVNLWNDSNSFVRFTVTQLQPGTPNTWVAYTRDTVNDGSTPPDYDRGTDLVDNGGGSYTLTLNTDIEGVTGVTYDSSLTHRVAGQIGSGGSPVEPQNMVFDFVPNGKSVTTTRNIAVMESCNECHDDLVFHGRRFLVEYCVQCHNPDLATGEGNMSFMTHRIHISGSFAVLDNAISYNELTYPQDVTNCRKCHSAGMPVGVTTTPDGDNWQNVPNQAACDGCHGEIEGDTFDNYHTAGAQPDTACAGCHSAVAIDRYHLTANATPHNPNLQAGQHEISYGITEAIAITGSLEVQFRIESDGTPLDLTNLPMEFTDGAGNGLRYPGLLLAWAQPQDGIMAPADFNNLGRRGAQPLSISLGSLSPIDPASTVGTLTFDAGSGNMTAIITNLASIFPTGAMMRTVGLQGYLQQDLDDDGASDVSLHTPSAVVTVTGDDERRSVVDSAKCGNCHEWFEGHGGNRVYEIAICTLCHVPNQSSSGRTIVTPSQGLLDDFADHGPIPGVNPNDPLTYPEDAQNLKDMVHGIHSSGFRTREYQHVRGGREGYYNWSEVTFPRGAETSNCLLCHEHDDTYDLELDDGLLATTVRTTSVADGADPDNAAVEGAFQAVPNATDWVNTPMASACGYCHTWDQAVAHMRTMGGFLSEPK